MSPNQPAWNPTRPLADGQAASWWVTEAFPPRPALLARQSPARSGDPCQENPRGPRRPDWCPPLQGLTEMMRSPFLSSPLRSAGPPARMKETKIPSPSSPPTMLKPSPVEPRCSTSFRGSLKRRNKLHHSGMDSRGLGITTAKGAQDVFVFNQQSKDLIGTRIKISARNSSFYCYG